jgi:hypothetical protein
MRCCLAIFGEADEVEVMVVGGNPGLGLVAEIQEKL